MKTHKKLLLCVFVSLGSSALSLAQTLPLPPISRQQDAGDQIFKEQQQTERQDIVERRSAVSLPEEKPQAALDLDPMLIEDPEPTFLIEKIEKSGDFPLGDGAFNKIVAPFLNKRLGVNRINYLLIRLNQALVDDGYITTRVYVGGQNLKDGTLQLISVPGKIEKILYNDKGLSGSDSLSPGLRLAFPFREGDTLNLRDLEQGIDQLNRLRMNRADMKIEPGETPGGSIVRITNAVGDRFGFSLGADNQGSSSTGTVRYRAGVDTGNVLGLMESWSFGYTGSLDTNTLNGSVSIPWGYNTFSFLATWSETQNLVGDVALMYSTTNNQALSWNHLISRNNASKTALDVSFNRRQAQREINGAELTPQQLTVIRAGINKFSRFPFLGNLGQWNADAGYSRGLPWFNADRDKKGIPSEAPHAQFNKIDFSGGLSLPLGTWLWKGMLTGQWTDTALFSSEQFFIGGYSSVRGLPESALAGDRGLLLRNELVYAQGFLIAETLRIDPFVFFDVGSTQYVADKQYHQLAGTGVASRFATRWGWAEVVLGFPVYAPAFIEKETFRLNATLALNF